MSELNLSKLRRRVVLKTDELDEKSSNEDVERFLANYFLEQWDEESKEEAAARQRAEQLAGRE